MLPLRDEPFRMTRKLIENTIPVLGVSDLERSIEFYRRVLWLGAEPRP